MESFVTITNGWKPLITVAKLFILDFCESSGYTSLRRWLLLKTKFSIAYIKLNILETFNMPLNLKLQNPRNQ